MWSKKTRARNYKAGKLCLKIFGFSFFLLSTIISVPKEKLSLKEAEGSDILGVFYTVLTWLQDNALMLVLLNSGVLMLSYLFTLSGDPFIKKHLQETLDEFRDDFFQDYEGEHTDFFRNHRITLFQRKVVRFRVYPKRGRLGFGKINGKCFYPWTGWLVPVMRSGHVYPQKPSVFLANDKDENQCEGVAGALWRAGKSKKAFAWDNLKQIQKLTAPHKKTEYAKKTFVDEKYIEASLDADKNLPRSIGGFTIKTERKLFVVVLDSTEPDAVTQASLYKYPMTMSMLSRLLERV